MELTAGSYVVTLFHYLATVYQKSVFCALTRRFFTWFGNVWDNSGLCRFMYHRRAMERAWPESILCRGLDWVLNLPLRALQKLYQVFKGPVEGSVCARFFLQLGSEAYVAAFWLIAALVSLHQTDYRNSMLLIVGGGVLLLVYLGKIRYRNERISPVSLQPWMAIFFLTAVLSVLTAVDVSMSARYLLYYAPCVMIVVALVHAANTPERLERIAWGLATGVLVTALYGLYQYYVIGVEPSSSYTDLVVNAGMPGRMYSLYDNPNALGGFLVLSLPVVAALALAARKRVWRVCAAVIVALGLACILMTYSRTSWIALAAAAVFYLLLWRRSALPYCLLVVLLLAPFLPDAILNRIASIGNTKDTSTNSRFGLFSAGWRVLCDYPLTGAGLGEDAVRAVVRPNGYYSGHDEFIHAHNMVLQMGAEMGLPGILSYVGLILGTMRESAQAVRCTECRLAKHIAIGGGAAMAGSFIYGLADYLWTYPRVMFIFWFVFGLALSAIRLCRQSSKKESP